MKPLFNIPPVFKLSSTFRQPVICFFLIALSGISYTATGQIAPVLTESSTSEIPYTENDPATQLTNTLVVTDDDSPILSATVVISSGLVSTEDVLSFTASGGITGSYTPATGTLSLSGSAAFADYQTVLRSVQYRNTSDNPATANRSIDFTVHDGTSPSNTISKTVKVTAVNDAPVLTDPSGSSISYTENTPAVQLTSTMTVSDADNANLNSAAVVISSGLVSTEDVLSFTASGGITGSYTPATGTLSLNGSATFADYQTVLRSVQYSNTSENPATANRTINFTVNDGTASSNAIDKTVTIIAVNDAPVLTDPSGSSISYTENLPAVQLTSTITVSDADNANLNSATVVISSGLVSTEDVLSFTASGGITGSYTPATGTLSLNGSATSADYQTVLRSVLYSNTSENPSTASRTINFTANDGTASSNAIDKTGTIISVNDAPVLTDPSGSSISYTENTPAVQLTGTITASDVDNTNLSSAKVVISSGLASSEDVLSFTASGGITGSYTAATGTLSLNGSATFADYQTVLMSVRYSNTSENPSTANRTINFTVNDGAGSSNTISKTVTITAVNDAPVLTETSSTPVSYVENAAALQLTGTITASDVDNTNLSSATVVISSGLVSTEDLLVYTDANGITGTYTASNGTLQLSGSATLANYQTALRSVQYRNSSENPNTSNRTVVFTVNDGAASSNNISKTVTVTTVNDAPVLTETSLTPVSYVENAAAVQLTNTISASDADNTSLTSAVISVVAGFDSSEDTLSFTSVGGITGSYSIATGVLTLSGSSSIANYQTALRSVKYRNKSDNPGTTSKIISFTVNDGSLNSNVIYKTVSITVVNDAPVLTEPSASAVTYTENASGVQLTSTIAVSDVDNAYLASATVIISSGLVAAQDTLMYTDANGITGTYTTSTGTLLLTGSATLAHYQAALRSIQYKNKSDNPATNARTISFRINDGGSVNNYSNYIYKTVNITSVNDAPVLTDPSTAQVNYTENASAVQLTSTIVIADVDNTSLSSATVVISSGLVSAEDTLSFTSANGITGSYTISTGTLSLSGSASLANYQTALRSVRYRNRSENPTAANRTISFTVNDGGSVNPGSNTIAKTITITSVNDAPVLTEPSSATVTYVENAAAVQLTNTITVSDIDNVQLSSATIAIVAGGFHSAEDTLLFTASGGITGSYSESTGILSLSGAATPAAYQTVLRSIRYKNRSENPNTTNRTISITVNDGSAMNPNSNTIYKTIAITAVNDAPELTEPSTATIGYTENATGVLLTSTINIADVDNTQLTSATISITSGLSSTQDSLFFTSGNGITGTYSASTGVLSLTGAASLSNYQTALRSVQYVNRSDNPSTTNRIITFRVNDGGSANNYSNTISKTVTITAVNDPPVASNVTISASDNKIGTTNTGSFTYSDPENDDNGTHTYAWYRSDYADGTGATKITGAEQIAYKNVKADGGKYISFEVTPVDVHGLAGTPVKSTFRYINANPVATNAYVYATAASPGDLLRGRFTYTDKENNPRGLSQYTWYRCSTINPTPASPGTLLISSTDSTYRLKNIDAENYIWYKVKPVATTGSTPGDSIWSSVIGPIGHFSARISGTDTSCAENTKPITLTITAGSAPYTLVLSRSGSTSNKDTTITGIQATPYVAYVKIPGIYVLKKLRDSFNDSASLTITTVIIGNYPKAKATISGSASICNDGVSRAALKVDFSSGTAPWTVTIRRRENGDIDTTLYNVTSDPFTLNARMIGSTPARHRIIAINDAYGCRGDTISGSAWVSYKTSPAATISGIDSICPGETATLTVNLTSGTPRWGFSYLRNGTNVQSISGISGYTYNLQVPNTGVYTLTRVEDQVCTGKVSGSAEARAYTVPTATMSGSNAICEYTTGDLHVSLTGHTPWKFLYRRVGYDTIEVPNVTSSKYYVPVKDAGAYNLYEVYDKNCKGTVSGSAVITIIPAPEVSISGIAPAYDMMSDQMVAVTLNPVGGTLVGEGVFNYPPNYFFMPRYATEGSHALIYSYQDPSTLCYGYDTTIVRILENYAMIELENNRTKYCRNDAPFTVTGTNLADDIGIFTISGGVGLVDHGNNTATVYPSQLAVNDYTITYARYTGTSFEETRVFEIGHKPNADFEWATECQTEGHSIALKNKSTSSYGYLNDTSYFWKIFNNTGYDFYKVRDIEHTFPDTGNYLIQLQIQNTYGCYDTINKILPLRKVFPLVNYFYAENFETRPIEWRSESSSTTHVNSWELGIPTKGFSPSPTGSTCWFTHITTTSTAAPYEQSWVTSPCFDFDSVDKPMLKLRIWRYFNALRDGATIQATVDSGKTWNIIGQLNDGINWFNEYTIYGNPGGQSIGWSNSKDGDWIESRHSLDALKGKTRVQFRIAYGSNGTALANNGIAFDDFSIEERNRMSLIEHFTNSSDPGCRDADFILDNFAEDHEKNAIDIQYHTADPANDPFYDDSKSVSDLRQWYYGSPDPPYSILNGGIESNERYNYGNAPLDENQVVIESLKDSKYWVIVSSNKKDNILNVKVQITALEDISSPQLAVRIAVIEREVKGVTGINGDTLFRNVVKAMLPTAYGTPIVKSLWKNGETSTVDESWDMQNVYDADQLRVVAFVQDEVTNEVYQAGMDTAGLWTGVIDPIIRVTPKESFALYPNPASNHVNILFKAETNEDITVELFNNLGRCVYTRQIPKGTCKTEFSTEEFPYGFYVLRVVGKTNLIGTGKLIISK